MPATRSGEGLVPRASDPRYGPDAPCSHPPESSSPSVAPGSVARPTSTPRTVPGRNPTDRFSRTSTETAGPAAEARSLRRGGGCGPLVSARSRSARARPESASSAPATTAQRSRPDGPSSPRVGERPTARPDAARAQALVSNAGTAVGEAPPIPAPNVKATTIHYLLAALLLDCHRVPVAAVAPLPCSASRPLTEKPALPLRHAPWHVSARTSNAREARLGSAGELGRQHGGPGAPHVPSVRC
jgi:hypothetical protein